MAVRVIKLKIVNLDEATEATLRLCAAAVARARNRQFSAWYAAGESNVNATAMRRVILDDLTGFGAAVVDAIKGPGDLSTEQRKEILESERSLPTTKARTIYCRGRDAIYEMSNDRLLISLPLRAGRKGNRVRLTCIPCGPKDWGDARRLPFVKPLDGLRISFSPRKRAWFLNVPVERRASVRVASERVAGIDLGVVVPAYMAVLDGPEQTAIGDGHTIRRMRHRFNYEKSRLRQLARFRKGHGRAHKLRPAKQMSDREHRYMDTTAAQLAATIIQTARRWRVGTLALEAGLKHPVHTSSGRVFWAPSLVKQKIRSAAEMAGIDVIEVPAPHTSQRCSECGVVDAENRSEQRYACKACGLVTHADLNAARNIAALAAVHHLETGLRVVGGVRLGVEMFTAIQSLVRGLRAACKNPIQPKWSNGTEATSSPRERLLQEPRADYTASGEVPVGERPRLDVAARREGPSAKVARSTRARKVGKAQAL